MPRQAAAYLGRGRPDGVMMQDSYHDFAGRYDLFFEEFGRHPTGQVEFFRKLFVDLGIASVLDCACGTGHDLAMFDGLGLKVTGSDASAAMLEQARKNLAGRGLEIPLVKADYRELPSHFSERFGAVVCLSTSLLEVGEEGEILKALRSMREVLEDGGALVLSQGTTDKQWSAKPRFIPVVLRPEFSRIMVIDYLGRGARYNILDVFHGAGGERLVVWSKEYPVVLLRDDYASMLKAAGFDSIEFYGGYGFEVYDETESDVLLVVAKKQGKR